MVLPPVGFILIELVEGKVIEYHPVVKASSMVAVIVPMLGSPVLAVIITRLGRPVHWVKHSVALALLLFTWVILCGCIQFWLGTRPPANSPPGIRPPARLNGTADASLVVPDSV